MFVPVGVDYPGQAQEGCDQGAQGPGPGAVAAKGDGKPDKEDEERYK